MSVQSYRDLEEAFTSACGGVAWQKADRAAPDSVETVYRQTQGWPREELYGLANQARRAAVSVPANIAEGQGRRGSAEMVHHLSMAHGSLLELETHLLIARRLGYLSAEACEAVLARSAEVGCVLNGLMRSMSGRAASARNTAPLTPGA